MIGHMTRQVMEARGFAIDAQGVRVRTGGLFVRATRYKRFPVRAPEPTT